MKILSSMLFLLLFSVISIAGESKTLVNTAVIRIQQEFNSRNEINSLAKKNKFQIVTQLLKQELSYTEKISNSGNYSILSPRILNIIEKEEPLLRTYIVHFEENISPIEYCSKLLRENNSIEVAEPYYLMELLAYKPNDVLIDNQNDLMMNIKAFNAWEIYKGDSTIVIGISDSGVDQNHEDLKDNIALNTNEIPNDSIDNDGNGYVDDYAGYNFAYKTDFTNPGVTINKSDNHGCQVAGIAGARTDNSRGMAGIGFKSKIFPIKVTEGVTLSFSYQCMIYAAIRGFKVLNCSWGGPTAYSSINQSIVDYAVANDVAIVAAGGNEGTAGANTYDTFYPSAYKGVLGVGEVYSTDMVTNGSVLGIQTRIMAPGVNNWATRNYNEYSSNTSGSSFSSPVVAGAVALARGKHPNLDAIQSLEFVRNCTDDISQFNTSNKALIPGRVNLYKIVTFEPFSIPSIVPDNFKYYTNSGLPTNRFKAKDTAQLKIDFTNYLGKATNIKFKLSAAYDPVESIALLDSILTLDVIEQESKGTFGNFKFIVTKTNKSRIIFRVDIEADNNYKDFFKFEFFPVSDMALIENDKIKISLSDDGEIGFTKSGSTITGQGISFYPYGNQIFFRGSCIMATTGMNKLAYNSNEYFRKDFSVVKDYYHPDANIGIITDANMGDDRLGVEIKQKWGFISDSSNSIYSDITLKNVINKQISIPAVGYYLDWDIGGSSKAERNRIMMIESALPENFQGKKGTAMMVYLVGEEYPVFGMAIKSNEADANAQAAALHYGITYDFNDEKRILSLNSGKEWIVDTVYDVNMVIGMQWEGNLNQGESKECKVCIAFAENQTKLEKELRNCINGFVSVNSSNTENGIKVFPNPAQNTLTITTDFELFISSEISIHNLSGQLVKNLGNFNRTESGINVDVSDLISGVYLIKIKNSNQIYWKFFIKE